MLEITPLPPSREDTMRYIEEMLVELRDLAYQRDLGYLPHLIDLARAESQQMQLGTVNVQRAIRLL